MPRHISHAKFRHKCLGCANMSQQMIFVDRIAFGGVLSLSKEIGKIRHSTVTLLLTTITEVLTDARHKQINIYLSTYLTYLPIDLSICICTYVWLTVITSTHAQHTLSLSFSLSLAHFTSSLHLQLHFTSLHFTSRQVTSPHSLTHTPHVNVGRPSPLTRVLHTT